VELLMSNYRVIPFTCSYIPGKGFVPQMFVKGLFSFVLFTRLGSSLLRLCLQEPGVTPFLLSPVAVAAFVLQIRRRRRARLITPMFEDELPSEVNPLRLNAD